MDSAGKFPVQVTINDMLGLRIKVIKKKILLAECWESFVKIVFLNCWDFQSYDQTNLLMYYRKLKQVLLNTLK